MSNPDPQVWRPDPANLPGTPPGKGAGGVGERGTSAFEGSSTHNEDYTLVAPSAPNRGPASGLSYYANEFPSVIPSAGSTTATRSTAGTDADD